VQKPIFLAIGGIFLGLSFSFEKLGFLAFFSFIPFFYFLSKEERIKNLISDALFFFLPASFCVAWWLFPLLSNALSTYFSINILVVYFISFISFLGIISIYFVPFLFFVLFSFSINLMLIYMRKGNVKKYIFYKVLKKIYLC
jgi:apolipoprotein N-acyltransferase